MERHLDSLVALYIAGLCGIGYGLRQIIEAQEKAGATIDQIVISGGAGRSDLIRQLLTGATGVRIAAPVSEEPVLLGSAILGAVAAGAYSDIPTAMQHMSRFARVTVNIPYRGSKGPLNLLIPLGTLLRNALPGDGQHGDRGRG